MRFVPGLLIVCIEGFHTYPRAARQTPPGSSRDVFLTVTAGNWGTVVDSDAEGLYIYLVMAEAIIRVGREDFQRLFTVRLRETQEQITQLQLVQAQSQLQALNTENDNGQA